VTLKATDCPIDLKEVAEAYFTGTLPEEQAIAFEQHYTACDTCATLLYKTADHVDTSRRGQRETS
jgi:hypothetical protein